MVKLPIKTKVKWVLGNYIYVYILCHISRFNGAGYRVVHAILLLHSLHDLHTYREATLRNKSALVETTR